MTTENVPESSAPAPAPSPAPTSAPARDAGIIKGELLKITEELLENTDWTRREGLRERRGKLYGELEALERKANPLYREPGKPGETPKGEQEQYPAPSLKDFGGPVVVEVPQDLTASQKEIASGYAQDIGLIATEAGIPAAQANELFAFTLDMDLAMSSGDADGSNPTASASILLNRYGPEGSARLIRDANEAVRRLPAGVKAWLEQRDAVGRALGNVPSVVAALAAYTRGDFKLSPATAQKELARLRGTKEYMSGDHATVDRVRLLCRVAARGQNAETAAPTKAAPPAPSGKSKLEAELTRLRLDEGYTDKGRANHKQILVRVQEIYRELHPDSK